MTAAQATIRRLYEQVRVLEAEAARPPKRRARLPYVVVLVAAVAIGAVSAGVSRSHVAVAVHKRAAAPVAHLIDPPAELARALPAAPSRHRVVKHASRRSSAPAHVVAPQHEVTAAPVVVATAAQPVEAQPAAAQPAAAQPVAPQAVEAQPAAAQPAAAQPAAAQPAAVQPVAPAAATPEPAVHAAAPAPAPAQHAPARPAKSAPAPVGVGSVVVSTSDEPVPDDTGATTSTTTTP